MSEETLITMRKDVFELILRNERAAAISERNIRSLQELVKESSKPVMKVYQKGKLIMTKGVAV